MGVDPHGRLMDEDAGRIALATGPLGAERVGIPRGEIRRTRPSALSPMPEGLLDRLSRKEVLDLFAYVVAEP